jgi:hypothetical protein
MEPVEVNGHLIDPNMSFEELADVADVDEGADIQAREREGIADTPTGAETRRHIAETFFS